MASSSRILGALLMGLTLPVAAATPAQAADNKKIIDTDLLVVAFDAAEGGYSRFNPNCPVGPL